MSFLDRFRRSTPIPEQTKQAVDVNSPVFLEWMRAGGSTGTVSAETAMRLSTVYACIKVISETIKTLTCHLYKVNDGVATMQVGAPLYNLISRRPNDLQTSGEWWEYHVAQMCLRGNSYAYITRTEDRTRVVDLLPLSADSVQPRLNSANQLSYMVTVGDPNKGTQRSFIARPNEILHFKLLTLDGVNGLSPISYNASLLSSAIHARDHALTVFTNGGTPRGVLKTEGTLSDEAFANIKASWDAAHSGTENANRIAILEAGLEFQPVSMSPADVQLLEARKMSRSEICGIFRVPPHMVGDLERATFSNISHQSLDFYKSTIAPWLHGFQQRLNYTLLGTTTQEFRFDVTELIRGDLQSEVTAYKSLLEIGVMNPNEVRARLGMNPRDGGDEYVSATNNLAFGDDPKTEEKPPEEPK